MSTSDMARVDMSAEDMRSPLDMPADMSPVDMLEHDLGADMPDLFEEMDAPPDMSDLSDMSDPPDLLDMSDMSDMSGSMCNGPAPMNVPLRAPRRKIAAAKEVDLVVLGANPFDEHDLQASRQITLVEGGVNLSGLTGSDFVPTEDAPHFGVAVAVSPDGAYIAAGSPGVNGNRGAVYLLRRNDPGPGWTLEQTFTAGFNEVEGALFGYDVALTASEPDMVSGERSYSLVVGAPEEGYTADAMGGYASRAGAIYIFHKSAAGAWTTDGIRRAPRISSQITGARDREHAAREDGHFGFSVDADGTWENRDLTVVVGAPFSDLVFASEEGEEQDCVHAAAGNAFLYIFAEQVGLPGAEDAFQFADMLPPSSDAIALDAALGGGALHHGYDVAIEGTFRRDESSQGYGDLVAAVSTPRAYDSSGEVYTYFIGSNDAAPSMSYGMFVEPIARAATPEPVLDAGARFGQSVELVGGIACDGGCVNFEQADVMLLVGSPRHVLSPSGSGTIHGFGILVQGGPEPFMTWSRLGFGTVGVKRDGFFPNERPEGFGEGVASPEVIRRAHGTARADVPPTSVFSVTLEHVTP